MLVTLSWCWLCFLIPFLCGFGGWYPGLRFSGIGSIWLPTMISLLPFACACHLFFLYGFSGILKMARVISYTWEDWHRQEGDSSLADICTCCGGGLCQLYRALPMHCGNWMEQMRKLILDNYCFWCWIGASDCCYRDGWFFTWLPDVILCNGRIWCWWLEWHVEFMLHGACLHYAGPGK